MFFLLVVVCLFSFYECVCVYVSFCDFVRLGLLLPFGLGFYLFVLGFFPLFSSAFSSDPCGQKGLGAPARCQA